MDLTRYLDVPDAQLQQYFPGEDIAKLKEAIRNAGKSEPSSKPVTQTIKINPATGEQEVTIKGSAQDLSAANPLTPTVAAPVIPQAYNQFTAQMESGNRPDIGYHDPSRSTAYGKYGITAPQYQEIQQQNPQFANRPITSLSQQEQDAANMASRDVYARQLIAKGIDPTEENIRMAHLLGAGGTRQYLNTGTFNQAAIDANRGEENLRRMVEQRRAGPVAPQPQARPQTMIAGQPSSDVGLTPTEQAMANQARTPGFNPAEPAPTWMDMTIANQGDPKKLYAMVADPNLPPEVQDAAKQRALSYDQQEQEKIKTTQNLQGFVQGDPRATSEVMKAIRQKSEEGSYVKAVLYSQLGLGELARQEQAKLSSGTFSKAILDGKPYMIETKNGAITRAWDAKGTAQGDEILAKINAASTPQGTAQFSQTGEIHVVPGTGDQVVKVFSNITGQPQWQSVKTGQVYKGQANPVPQSIYTTMAKEDYRLITDLKKKHGGNVLDALRDYQIEKGPLTAENRAVFMDLYGMGQAQPGQPGPGVTMPNVQIPPPGQGQAPMGTGQVPTTPGVPPQARPPAGPAPAPVAQGPVAPAAPQARPPAGPAPVVPGQPAPVAQDLTRPIGEIKRQGAIEETAGKKEAEITAEDRAKIKTNFGAIKENVDQIENLGQQLINHPGFSVSVGASAQPGFQFIPGTDKAGFYELFTQVQGKAFQQAIETLRGTGAISDYEAKSATAAVTRMSLAQNEKEFIKAKHEFVSQMKRYADRAAGKIGEAPIYGEKTMSEQAKENAAAKEWLKKNPKDPQAEAVRAKLRERGEL